MPITQEHIDAYIKAHKAKVELDKLVADAHAAYDASKDAIASQMSEGEQRSITSETVRVWEKVEGKLQLIEIPPLLG